MRQVFGKTRGAIDPRQVTRGNIARDFGVDKPLQPIPRRRFAHLHKGCQNRRPPAHRGPHVPVGQIIRRGPVRRRGDPRRGRHQVRQIPAPDGIPERGVDFVEPACPGLHRHRFKQHMARKTARFHAISPQRRPDRRVPRLGRRVIQALPPDRRCPGSSDQVAQNLQRRTPAQDQTTALCGHSIGKHPNRRPHPKLWRSPQGIGHFIQNKQRNNRTPGRTSRTQGSMVRQPQIAPKPQDDRAGISHSTRSSAPISWATSAWVV